MILYYVLISTKRVDLTCCYHTHTHTQHKHCFCELMDVITNLWYAFHSIYVCGPLVNNPPANERGSSSIPGLGRSPGERVANHSSILAGKSHGQRSLAGYSP